MDRVGWPLCLFIGAYFFGGFFTTKEAIQNLIARFEIDTLMLVAAAGAQH
jgi:Cd2+/Zn2+-exporting ATPase